jgi:DNA-binding MarR family transcriptional regulator
LNASIKDELRMRRLESAEQEAFLNVWRTQEILLSQMAELYKSHDVSVAQYNALRILRGVGTEGLSCQGVAERLVARVPDITRLLDRLESKGLITRDRDAEDRRVVTTRISRKGLRLLSSLDQPVLEAHRRQFGHMSRRELSDLNRLLDKVRQTGGSGKETMR